MLGLKLNHVSKRGHRWSPRCFVTTRSKNERVMTKLYCAATVWNCIHNDITFRAQGHLSDNSSSTVNCQYYRTSAGDKPADSHFIYKRSDPNITIATGYLDFIFKKAYASMCSMAFTWDQFYKKCSWALSQTWVRRSHLTHFSLNKMAAILQTAFWNAFSWMKSFVSRFLRVQMTITQHWFR